MPTPLPRISPSSAAPPVTSPRHVPSNFDAVCRRRVSRGRVDVPKASAALLLLESPRMDRCPISSETLETTRDTILSRYVSKRDTADLASLSPVFAFVTGDLRTGRESDFIQNLASSPGSLLKLGTPLETSSHRAKTQQTFQRNNILERAPGSFSKVKVSRQRVGLWTARSEIAKRYRVLSSDKAVE